MKIYPVDSAGNQCQVIEKIVDPNKCKRKYLLIDVQNALLYIALSGIQYLMLSKEFAPYKSLYYYINN